MKLSRRGFLAVVPWLAWPAQEARAAMVLDGFLWGQTREQCLGETLAVLGLGVPKQVSTLGGHGNAWCATLHYGESRTLVVTSGVDALASIPAILRGARGVLQFDGRTWRENDGRRYVPKAVRQELKDQVMAMIRASLSAGASAAEKSL